MDRLKSLLWSFGFALVMISFMTSLAVPGFAGPIVKITQPRHNQTVTGQIMIQVAYESDSNQPITRLEIYVDGKLGNQYVLAVPRTRGVQSFKWDFTMAAATAHSISARAIDAAGEVGAAEITVEVTRADTSAGADRIPPVVNIYYPAQGARVAGEIEVRVDATDNVGVKYVFFYIDGKLHKMIMNAPPFVDVWDTTRVADGPHVLQAKAMDEAENPASSAEVTVFVENHTMTSTPMTALAQPATPPVVTRSEVPTMAPPPTPPTPPAPPSIASTPASGVTSPIMGAPQLTAPQPTVTPTRFGVTTSPSERLMTRREIERAPVGVQVARYGYLPTLPPLKPTTRTSQPELMLAALPAVEETPAATIGALPAGDTPGAAIAPRTTGDMIAAANVQPRLTVPRMLAAQSAVTTYGDIVALEETADVSATIAALPAAPRLTTPRASIPEMEYLDTGASSGDAGWVRMEPALQVRPSEVSLAPRLTAPLRELPAAEVLATPDELGSDVMTVLVRRPGADNSEGLLAMLHQRTSTPGMLEAQPRVVAAATDTDVRPLEVAVLPASTRRAAIPADGKLTTPSGVPVAPVAMTQFQDIQVLFNAKALDLLASPEFRDGISLAPLREIFEATDGVLYWFPVEKRVRAVNADTEINLQIGDPSVRVNDQTRVLEVAPYIKKGRTMVPLQFIADTLDVTVTFNPRSGQICLTSNKF
ncbi:MAG: hypothetical protein J7M38_10020 [Armatimonadetes bacterium]|nr:hypothetical protein [Armatimonadota bacterium]